MNALQSKTEHHLQAHHRDFKAFAQTMIETHPSRFDAVFWTVLQSALPTPPRTIVDLGTGPGLLLLDLAKLYPQARVYGVEAQPEMLKKAMEVQAQGHGRIEVIARDLADPIPELPTGTVDLVVASMVLHELPDPTPLIREAHRALRVGGAWIVYDWVRQPLSTYFEGKAPTSLDEFQHFSEHSRLTSEDLVWLLTQSGFEADEVLTRNEGRHCLGVFRRA